MSKDSSYYKYLHGLQTIGDEERVEYLKGNKELSKIAESSQNVGEKCNDDDEVDSNGLVDKNEIKRARLLAKKDTTYLLIGIIGGLLTGSTFPASGVSLKVNFISLFGRHSLDLILISVFNYFPGLVCIHD